MANPVAVGLQDDKQDAARWRMLMAMRASNDKQSLCIAWYDGMANQRIAGLGGRDPVAIIDAAIAAESSKTVEAVRQGTSSMSEQEQQQQREYRTVSYLVTTLANICAAAPNQIIDRLTGLLWDAEEAAQIKSANQLGADSHAR